jgi:hypothetical protein
MLSLSRGVLPVNYLFEIFEYEIIAVVLRIGSWSQCLATMRKIEGIHVQVVQDLDTFDGGVNVYLGHGVQGV